VYVRISAVARLVTHRPLAIVGSTGHTGLRGAKTALFGLRGGGCTRVSFPQLTPERGHRRRSEIVLSGGENGCGRHGYSLCEVGREDFEVCRLVERSQRLIG